MYLTYCLKENNALPKTMVCFYECNPKHYNKCSVTLFIALQFFPEAKTECHFITWFN